MSGVSLFGKRSAPAVTDPSTPEGGSVVWSFDKASYEEDNSYDYYDEVRHTMNTHLLTENGETEGYRIVGVARGDLDSI